MVDAVEFYPVEVTKNFMSLTVGDILRMNPNTGRYELHIESEDIGETIYKYDKYEISFEPWVIQKYMDHFQIYESIEKSKEATELPLTPDPDECYERNDSAFEELKEDLEVFRVEVERLNAMIEEIKNREDNTKSTSRKVTVKK